MTENEAIVSSLEEKIGKLVSAHQQLLNDIKRLEVEKNELTETVHFKDNQLKEANTKYEQLKLARLLVSGSSDVHDAKLKVNKIVREIDKCIALLNK